MTNQLTLSDKVALVTGASRGIGRAIARGYAAAGAAVGCAARDEAGLAALVAEIEAAGGRAVALPTDVTDELAAYKLAETPFPGYFGVFYKVNRPTKNANEAKIIQRAKTKVGDLQPWEILKATFDRMK